MTFSAAKTVALIFDPEFGDELKNHMNATKPVWIARSVKNEVAVRRAWQDPANDVTIFEYSFNYSVFEFMQVMWSVSDHENWKVLEVIGHPLNADIRNDLENELSIQSIQETKRGFVVTKAPHEQV